MGRAGNKNAGHAARDSLSEGVAGPMLRMSMPLMIAMHTSQSIMRLVPYIPFAALMQVGRAGNCDGRAVGHWMGG